jgi:hypothetical protein
MRTPFVPALRHLVTCGCLLVAAAVVTPGTVMAQSQLIGDKDCFGFGGYPCASLANINLPEDRRSAAEAAATNGAQQTDFYSANFSPLPFGFNVIFPMAVQITSGTLSIGMGGFQATTFGQLAVLLNGVFLPNYFNFEDGPLAVVERSFLLSAAQVAAVNADGELRLTINRGNSTDGIAFDYFQFDYTPTAVVAEPMSMILLGTGLIGIAGIRRRRSKQG